MTGCSGTDCANCLSGIEQPHGVEIYIADNVFIKQMIIPKSGTAVPQHSHRYDHTSLLTNGSVQIFKDGVFEREAHAPEGIFIGAGIKHAFVSLEDNTTIFCIHNISRGREVEIVEEHQFVSGE